MRGCLVRMHLFFCLSLSPSADHLLSRVRHCCRAASSGRERMLAASLAAASSSSAAKTMLTFGSRTCPATRPAATVSLVAAQRSRGYGGKRADKSRCRWRRYWGVAPESEASEVVSVVRESGEARCEEDGEKPAKAPQVWEVDFCSRPILDERRKKVGLKALGG